MNEKPKVCMPVAVAFPSPFRLIMKDASDTWGATLQDINKSTYNYVKLNRVSPAFDGNIAPYAMFTGFDGSLIVPLLPEYRDFPDSAAVFNRVLAELLLGGVYTEAVAPTDILFGHLLETGYVRVGMSSASYAASFHTSIRMQCADPSSSIRLLDPPSILFEDYERAVHTGRGVLATVPTLSPEIFLSGITHFVRGQFPEALVTMWTAVEQVLSHVWDLKVRQEGSKDPSIPGRKKFLEDYRTWPASTRIELLYQIGFVPASVYVSLDEARKARNAFIHSGKRPPVAAVKCSIEGAFGLLSLCASDFTSTARLHSTLQVVLERQDGYRFPHKGERAGEPTHWRYLPPLPGETGWKEAEYETFDLGLVPIEQIEARKEAATKPRKR